MKNILCIHRANVTEIKLLMKKEEEEEREE